MIKALCYPPAAWMSKPPSISAATTSFPKGLGREERGTPLSGPPQPRISLSRALPFPSCKGSG